MRISRDLEAKKGLLYNERGKLKKTSKFIGIQNILQINNISKNIDVYHYKKK